MEINLDKYKPVIDTKDLPDYVLELWYGGKVGLRIIRLLENSKIIIEYSISGDPIIRFLKICYSEDNWLLHLDIENLILHYNYRSLMCDEFIHDIYNKDYINNQLIIKNIIKNYYSFEVKDIIEY